MGKENQSKIKDFECKVSIEAKVKDESEFMTNINMEVDTRVNLCSKYHTTNTDVAVRFLTELRKTELRIAYNIFKKNAKAGVGFKDFIEHLDKVALKQFDKEQVKIENAIEN